MQTLKEAIYLAASGKSRRLARAAHELDGKPVGGWAVTTQAMRAIVGDLPQRSLRDYTMAQFVASVYRVERGYYRTTIWV